MVEVYLSCSSREISPDYLKLLEGGWLDVFTLLKEIGVGEIRDLPVIEITLLDDAEMARIHGDFLNDATPTDVITFQHGELLIGVEVAARQAEEFGSSADREIALYGIHGMLHLAGFDDRTPDAFEKMAARQNELLQQFFPFL